MAKRLFEVDKCSVCLGSHARARPSTSASSGSPELAEVPGPTAGGRYRIQAPETRSGAVKVWSSAALSFDNKPAWQRRLVQELREALKTLDLDHESALHGAFAADDAGSFDIENRLFYNVGSGAFPDAPPPNLAPFDISSRRLTKMLIDPQHALLPGPAFKVHTTWGQLDPLDELCDAGRLVVRGDARDQHPQLSGELFVLSPSAASSARGAPRGGDLRASLPPAQPRRGDLVREGAATDRRVGASAWQRGGAGRGYLVRRASRASRTRCAR